MLNLIIEIIGEFFNKIVGYSFNLLIITSLGLILYNSFGGIIEFMFQNLGSFAITLILIGMFALYIKWFIEEDNEKDS